MSCPACNSDSIQHIPADDGGGDTRPYPEQYLCLETNCEHRWYPDDPGAYVDWAYERVRGMMG